jgi:predicted dithiol-disulfide oxidoreductase (DUF899 family)
MEAARRKLVKLRRQLPPEPVEDYELKNACGPVRLSELFGGGDDLILIHNMGTGCSNCTMWADGFNGIYDHLRSRVEFVVVSPDSPEVQQAFARKRGWRFPMYSAEGTTFAKDLGFQWEGEAFLSGFQPGVSVFRRENAGRIVRVAKDSFGPGDLYCGTWHLFDLLPDGPAGWDPLFTYPTDSS